MCDKVVLGDEGLQFLHHLVDVRGSREHPVRNAGVLLDKAGYSHFGIHETLEPVHNLII